MKATEQLQSLKRGLKALIMFSDTGAITVAALARKLEVPRTTAYRILNTLRSEGYIERLPNNYGFKLTAQVRQLSDGFDEEFWISTGAVPLIEQLARDIRWPLAITTPQGDHMLVRASTDHLSPVTFRKFRVGHRVPMLGSTAGHVYLAFCNPQQQKQIIDIIAKSADPRSAHDIKSLRYLLDKIRNQGYVILEKINDLPESNIAVPILVDGVPIASLTMRYITSALKLHQVTEDYLSTLQSTANTIVEYFKDQSKLGTS